MEDQTLSPGVTAMCQSGTARDLPIWLNLAKIRARNAETKERRIHIPSRQLHHILVPIAGHTGRRSWAGKRIRSGAHCDHSVCQSPASIITHRRQPVRVLHILCRDSPSHHKSENTEHIVSLWHRVSRISIGLRASGLRDCSRGGGPTPRTESFKKEPWRLPAPVCYGAVGTMPNKEKGGA